jgi:hypothetical protein
MGQLQRLRVSVTDHGSVCILSRAMELAAYNMERAGRVTSPTPALVATLRAAWFPT